MKSSYGKFRQPRDVAQILLSVLFLAIMLWHVCGLFNPLFSALHGPVRGYRHLAGIVTFAKDHVWPPPLAVLVMTLLLVMVFIIPIACWLTVSSTAAAR